MTKVCYFGTSNGDITRTRIITQGLADNNVAFDKCEEHLAQIKIRSSSKLSHLLYHILVGIDLLESYLKLITKFMFKSKGCNVILVSFPFRYDAVLAYFLSLFTGKKVIVDYFMSMYETTVIDRKKVKPGSFTAKKLFFIDYLTVYLADKLIVDTAVHAAYYQKLLGVNCEDKFTVVPIGAYDKIITPLKRRHNLRKFTVLFWGYFVPLQGVEYIIKSAKLLEHYKDIQLVIIGIGQTFIDSVNLAKSVQCKNVEFLGEVRHTDLPAHISGSDICLGIFGNNIKTDLVIPNKAYEAIAAKKPLLTADTAAIRELFTHKENCFLCEKANEKSLADSILYLKNNPELRNSIAEKGYALFKEKCTPAKVVENLVRYINVI